MKFLHTQVEKFFQGGWGLRTIGLGYMEGMGQNTPCAPRAHVCSTTILLHTVGSLLSIQYA